MKEAFLTWANVFTPAELDAIERMGDALVQQRAVISVPDDDSDAVRITKVAWLERNAQTGLLYERIEKLVQRFNAHSYQFEVTGLEDIQYTVYHGAEGGHYDWHIDHGPHNLKPRKISISIQLSDSAQYEGCDLQFRVGPKIGMAPRERGTAIAFPSFFLHRVTPITSGTRKALVIWATGPDFR